MRGTRFLPKRSPQMYSDDGKIIKKCRKCKNISQLLRLICMKNEGLESENLIFCKKIHKVAHFGLYILKNILYNNMDKLKWLIY